MTNDQDVVTNATFEYSSTGGAIPWAGGAGIPGDQGSTNMLTGHIYDGSATVLSATFSNIPYATYDLYVYYHSSAVTNNQTFTINGTSTSLDGFEVGGVDTALVDSRDGAVNGNYVVFKGLASADVTVDATADGVSGGYVYMNGFQVVSRWGPHPGDGEVNVSPAVVLSWADIPLEDIIDVTYVVYLQKDDPNFVAPIAEGLDVESYDPEPDLDMSAVYYWQVVAHGLYLDTDDPNYDPEDPIYTPMTIVGNVWQFSTAGTAVLPVPEDEAIEVEPNSVLQWDGLAGLKHDVYFGTDANSVTNADINTAGIYQGRQDVSETTFDPYGLADMDWSTTYCWRIDEVDESTTPDTITEGNIWSFTTIVPQCPVPPVGDTNNDCIVDMQDIVNIAKSWVDCAIVPEDACP